MKINTILLFLALTLSLNANSQGLEFEKSGISSFIDFYSSNYGEEEVESIYKKFSNLDSDSLSNILSTMTISAKLQSGLLNVTNNYQKIHKTMLIGFLAYSKLVNRNINDRAIYWYGAMLKKLDNNNIGAIQDYTKALNSNPDDVFDDISMIGYRGLCKFTINDYYGAIDDLSKAINGILVNLSNGSNKDYELLESELSDFILARGRSYFLLNKIQNAISDYNQALNYCNGSCAVVFYLRGIAYLASNKKHLGCLDLSKAGEMGYNDAYPVIEENCK